ncbi:MAG TPA: DUF4384 domain-containing protein [Pyrinomonadaceae bacterium]|nr:DUF4384 domain-containing protein [Pyrinomonadaceae bacterium]
MRPHLGRALRFGLGWLALLCVVAGGEARGALQDATAGPQEETGARQILPFFPDARAKAKTDVRPVYRAAARRRHSGSRAKYEKPPKRPAAGGSAGVKSGRRRRPKPVAQTAALDAAQKLGVTIWKLRPASLFADPLQPDCGEGTRSLGQPTMVTPPTRVSASTLFRTGDRVRLGIETVRAGYLYVLNREVYADRTLGPVSLIFPTRRMRGGQNFVAPGRPVEFPDLCDRPNYIEFLPPSRARRPVAEQLVLVVADRPLTDLPVPADSVRIPEEFLRLLEARWAGPSEELELEDGEGQAYTSVELNAAFEISREGAGAGGRALVHAAPQPQTVFAVNAPRPDGVLVTLLLWYE